MSDLNNPIPQPVVRQPRGLVLVNGKLANGMVSFQVDNNSFYQADTFRCEIALSAQPVDRGIGWWLDQDQIEVDLRAGFPQDPERYGASELQSLLIGYVDDIEIDPAGTKITLTGRDHTAKLIDTKSSLSNITGHQAIRSSEIVAKIAGIVGLNPVITPTKSASPGGSYYSIVKAVVDSNTTFWNIVTRLAQMEQYVAYVSGNDLHFEPRAIAGNDAYVIRWTPPGDNSFPSSNAVRMSFSRNLYVAKDIKVTVLSHNYKTDRPVVATAEKTRIKNAVTKGAGSSKTPPVEYVYTFSNMNPSDAQARANALLLELSQHEMNLHVEMPGDSILTSRSLIRVQGTGSRADQTYYPASIVRTLSIDDGYRMEITAKNISPDVEITK